MRLYSGIYAQPFGDFSACNVADYVGLNVIQREIRSRFSVCTNYRPDVEYIIDKL